MPVDFLPFKTWRPDGGQYGPDLKVARNVLPIDGSWRPMRKGLLEATVADGPPVGGYVHMYQQARAIQYMRPDSDISNAGAWLRSTGGDNYALLDEVDPSDSDFVFKNAPSSAIFIVSLSNPVGSVAASGYIVRWRYNIPETPSGSSTITCELLETTTVRATDTVTTSAATSGYVTRVLTLSGGEIASIVSLNNLRLRFTATVPGATQEIGPSADVTVTNFLTNSGGSSNLFATLDETVASDADYIRSSILAPGGPSAVYRCELDFGLVDPVTNDGLVIRCRNRVTNDGANYDLVAKLYSDETLVTTLDVKNIDVAFGTIEAAIPEADAALLNFDEPLELELTATLTSVASTVSQFGRPVGYLSSSGISTSAGTLANSYQLVDDVSPDDASTYVVSTTGAGTILWNVDPNLVDPLHDTNGGFQLRARAANLDSTTAREGRLTLYQGAVQICFVEIDLTASQSWTDFSHNLTLAEAALISGYASLRLEFLGDSGVALTQAYIAVPEPVRVDVSWLEVGVPSAVRAEIGWAEMEVPDADTTYKGDVPTTFIGTQTKLYVVTNAAFDDISKGGGYAGSTTRPAAWDLCSFGNHVVATNFIDPVQFREDNAGDFKDMIGGTDKPKARFCRPVRNHLMLANINMAGHYADEIWWSAINDCETFDPSFTTQCGNARLVSTPGEIMGLVGGDSALIFKRRAIHRLTWIGGQPVFRSEVITSSNGTPYSRSIVEADSLVYWWGYDGFYRYNGDGIEAVGGQVVMRYLRDSRFSEGGIAQIQPDTILEEDQIMVGWYDRFCGLLFWEYQGVDDSNHLHNRVVVYNPIEDRWSEGRAEDLLTGSTRIGWAMAMPNVTNSDTFDQKGTILVGWDGTTMSQVRLAGKSTAAVTLQGKRMSIGLGNDQRPQKAEIKGVMPLYSVEPETAWPEASITVESALDPRMVNGASSQTYVQSQAKEDQFFPHDNAGLYFQFTLELPSMEASSVIGVDGLYVHHEPGGEP